MGTGVVSTLAHSFPYGTGSLALKVITLLFFFLNLLLFVIITGASAARYVMFPKVCSAHVLAN
jgi:tellurite resistance protein TehA-like permease